MNRPNVRGRGRGMSKAQSVLSRASSQLKGEQVTSRDEKDDDDVGAYLSALTKRTNVQPQWDKLGNAADLSESDDDRNAPPTVDTVASKFLKKKPAAVAQSAQGAKYPKREARPSVMGQSGGGGAGSLLDKAAVYTEKYSSHAAAGRGEILHLSESDMDLSFSLDDSIVAEVTPVKMTTGKPGQKPTNRVDSSGSSGEDEEKVSVSQRFHRAKSIESEDDSMVIGKGGNRFLKKKKPEPGSSLQKEKEATTKKKKSAVTGVNVRGIEKFSTHLMLDSDEESMQGYIQNLSDLASTPRSPTPKTPRSIKTPRSLTTMEDISEEAEMSRSEPRHQLKSDDASQSSNDSFKINVMDLNVLEPAPLVISPPGRDDGTTGRVKKQKFSQSDSGKTDHSGKKSEKRVSDKTKRKKTSTKSNYEMPRRKDKDGKKTSEKEVKKTSSFFSSMGLHTVDELFGVDEDKVSDVSEVSSSVQPSEQPTYDYHAALASRSPSPLRSILSGSSRPITPKSSRSHVRLSLNDEITEIRSRSPSPEAISTARPSHASTVYTEDFESESVTEHASSYTRSGAESENSASSYTSSRSVSSHRSSCSSRSIRSTRSTRSSRSKATTARSDDGYSDDFGTESSHRSERSHSPVTESGDNRSMSSMVRPRRRPKVKQRNAAIQTGVDLEAGLIYHWNVENSVTVVGQQYGLGYVDPTPIATHVVSADALEAMTAYNPSTVALNDMLRQQLRLTTDFIEAQKQLHRHLLGSLAMQHHYTTLADTKKYIKQHRKPKLTFDEALRQVKEEMALQ